MNVASLRNDFPLLSRRMDGNPIIYLDSAATSLKPLQVLEAERRYSIEFTANIHRGKHALSEEASAAYEDARRRVARLLGVEPSTVVFVRNTTEALNLLAQGLALEPDEVVLGMGCDHHANLVPWMRRGRLELLESDPCLPLGLEQLEAALLRHRPRVVALSWASNLTGVVHPVAELCALARAHGALTVVDGAQGAPHFDPAAIPPHADFLAFSGHKMLGPTGVGVLWGRRELLEQLEPLVVGGGAVAKVTRQGYTLRPPPHRFEAGTPNISGALGLAAAIDYLERVGYPKVVAHAAELASGLDRALADLPGARVLRARAGPRLPLASVVPTGRVSPDQLALMLSDSHQIMVRSGHHCVHPCFDALGLSQGAIRVSAYLYNTVQEIQRAGDALRRLLERFADGQ